MDDEVKRVLLVSKYEQLVGGVEQHVQDLAAGLRRVGVSVRVFSIEDLRRGGLRYFSADDSSLSSRLKSAQSLLWNQGARELFRSVCREFKPDLVHFHSIYHHLSPSLLGIPSVPTVMTLHDFKLVAPCYTLLLNGEFCDRCVGSRFDFDAIRFKCVKGSTVGSALCAAEDYMHFSRYIEGIDRFIVPSAFSQDIMRRGNVPSDKLTVVPWGVDISRQQGAASDWGRYFVYVGRLHGPKGVGVLLDAWSKIGLKGDVRLIIAGDGALRDDVVKLAATDDSIVYLGQLSRDDVSSLVSGAELAIVPSINPETMGLSAVESLVLGTPLVATGAGALQDLHGPGVVPIPVGDVSKLASTLETAIGNPGIANSLRRDLAERDMSLYSADRMVGDIVRIYSECVSIRGVRG